MPKPRQDTFSTLLAAIQAEAKKLPATFAQLEQIARRDAVSSAPDGWPAAVGGGGVSGGGVTSPVESAVIGLQAAHGDVDVVAKAHRQGLDGAVAILDALRRTNAAPGLVPVAQTRPDPEHCALCARISWKVVAARRGNPRQVFATELDLCTPHYTFVQDNGRAPTDDEARRYQTTGRWRITAGRPTYDRSEAERRIAGLDNLRDGMADIREAS